MDEFNWSQLPAWLSGIGAIGMFALAFFIKPIRAKINALRDVVAKVEALEKAMVAGDDKVRQDIKAAVQESVDGMSKVVTDAMKKASDDLASHTREDSEKHREIFDQNRALIEKVGELKGLVEGAILRARE